MLCRRILQSSLDGNAKVAVICTVSPGMKNFEESTSTLKFATRLKKVVTTFHLTKVNAHPNEARSSDVITIYF
jgi:hypothetical protein